MTSLDIKWQQVQLYWKKTGIAQSSLLARQCTVKLTVQNIVTTNHRESLLHTSGEASIWSSLPNYGLNSKPDPALNLKPQNR